MASTIDVGGVRLTRVPYFDVPLAPETVGLTAEGIASLPWAVPAWADAEGHALVGQAIWVVESADRVLVVDPCGAADEFLRSGPDAVTHQRLVRAALADGGFPPERVDAVILSHLDGIGMVGVVDEAGGDGWGPMFANARIVVSEAELALIHADPTIQGAAAFGALEARGLVDAVSLPWEAAPGVVLEASGGHSAGHALLRIGDGAVFLGHLALNPLKVAFPLSGRDHEDNATVAAVLDRELAAAAEAGGLVIGPLWPEPGCGRVTGPPWVINPA
jgi:hypothetical protein